MIKINSCMIMDLLSVHKNQLLEVQTFFESVNTLDMHLEIFNPSYFLTDPGLRCI
jgi:hypothetical protein